ncbi:MAG: addiction module antidote protein [Burkholderiaceae bacterium]
MKSKTVKTTSAKPKTTAIKTVPFDVAHHLRTPAAQVAYLNAWLEESPEDVAGIARAFGDVVRARGMTKVANQTGLSRESLYKAFSEKGNPKLATVLAVANAIDLTIRVELPPPRARKRQLTPA